MKKLLIALLLLTGAVQAQQNPFAYPKYVSGTGGGGGATAPGGTPTQVQYNNAGAFDGITSSSVIGTQVGVGMVAAGIGGDTAFPASSIVPGTFYRNTSNANVAIGIGNNTRTMYIGVPSSTGGGIAMGASNTLGTTALFRVTEQGFVGSGHLTAPLSALAISGTAAFGSTNYLATAEVEVRGTISATTIKSPASAACAAGANIYNAAGLISCDNAITVNGTGGISATNLEASNQVSSTFVRVGNGTVGLPAITNLTNTTSGFYFVPATGWAVSAGGAQRALFAVAGNAFSGPMLIGGGASAVPVAGTALQVSGSLQVTGTLTVSALANSTGTNPTCYNTATGSLSYSVNCTASDERLKTNITTRTGGLAKIMALRPVTYEWRNPEIRGYGTQLGFIAQEVAQVIPQAAFQSGDNEWGIAPEKMIPDLVQAVQELKARIELLEDKQALIH